jgi:hypothetical protein
LRGADSWQKEQFSLAFLLAVATSKGYTIAHWNVDKDGVDATIRSSAVMVDFQLKCTQSPRESRGAWVYDLDIPTFNKLRNRERSAPGYLALVVVPPDLEDWLSHEPERLLILCHGYWAKIQDMPAASGGTKTAIRIPKTQRLDGAALEVMFKKSLERLIAGIGAGAAA